MPSLLIEALNEEKIQLEEKVESLETQLDEEKRILKKDADSIDTSETSSLGSSTVLDKREMQSLKKKLKQEKKKEAESKKQYDELVTKYKALQTAHSKQFYLSVVSLILLSLLIHFLYSSVFSQTIQSDITI